nr:hypothetical protein [Tanacetum cinerariifolium]
SAIFLAVASLFFWQWEPSSLAVRSSSGSGNFIAGSGNALCILFPTSPYAMLGQPDSEEESEKVMLRAGEGGQDEGQAEPDPDAGAQDEGQVGLNPDENFEGQAGPDPGNAGDDVHYIPSLMVHAGSDREHMDLDVADVSPQPTTKQLDEVFTTTAYPKVQENLKLTVEEQVLVEEPASSSGTLSSLQHLSKDISFRDLFFSDKPSDVDKNAETEVESMVNVSIQQDLSSISLMTSPIIDLTSRPESPKPPPPPLPAGPSGAFGAFGAPGSSLVPPPLPPPSSTNQDTEYQAWMTTDIRLSLSISLTPADLEMDEDMVLDKQAQSLDDEDIGSARIPKVNLRQDWWKPFEEERSATSEPACVDDPILRLNVSKPLPLGGPPGEVTIQSNFFFNKDLEYLRYGSKGRRP